MSCSTSRNCLERRIFGFRSTNGGSCRGLDLRLRSRAPDGKRTVMIKMVVIKIISKMTMSNGHCPWQWTLSMTKTIMMMKTKTWWWPAVWRRWWWLELWSWRWRDDDLMYEEDYDEEDYDVKRWRWRGVDLMCVQVQGSGRPQVCPAKPIHLAIIIIIITFHLPNRLNCLWMIEEEKY